MANFVKLKVYKGLGFTPNFDECIVNIDNICRIQKNHTGLYEVYFSDQSKPIQIFPDDMQMLSQVIGVSLP